MVGDCGWESSSGEGDRTGWAVFGAAAFGCSDSLDPTTEVRAPGVGFALVLATPRPIPPLIDCLEAGLAFFGAGGGAIEVLPVVLSLDFVLESDVLAVVAGVPVLGVEAAELAEDTALVGDLVGDCDYVSTQLGCVVHRPTLTDGLDPTVGDPVDIMLCLFLAASAPMPAAEGRGLIAPPLTGA